MIKCLPFLNNPEYPKEQRTLEQWRSDGASALSNAAVETKNSLDSDWLQAHTNFINYFFLMRPSAQSPPGMFFDSGLIYRNVAEGLYRPICQAACDALLKLFRADSSLTLDDVLGESEVKQGESDVKQTAS